ncbi:hypothetical protein [Cyanobium sp. CH-040]|uniref:hypothetical protein n=1 Tax=Cyanobium sp. CH-040 TaxID=2823708 RepID=UPI0020CC4AEF|nr:hypothetical protein [Cyanobium sp. CH-040]MCP9928851.1 hypothetical protein [Cyanobium sp. CH-040]
MGQITDTLRATLRELAQSDARLYRGLEQELRDVPGEPAAGPTLIEPAPEARASRADLESLSIKVLWGLCKQRGIKRLSSGPKDQQVEALLNHPGGPPLRSALPLEATKASKGRTSTAQTAAKAGAAELQALEQRLDRLEQLVLLIAQQVGVPPEAIAQLASAPSALPPT